MKSIITGKILAMILLLLVLTNLNPSNIPSIILSSMLIIAILILKFSSMKLEEKQLEEERAAKAKNWKLPVCYDDDDDEEISDSLDDNIISGLPSFSAITPDEPVLSTEEPYNSLSMGDEHLDTIPTTKSDEFIKFGVDNLIPILSEPEGIPDRMCDVPFHDNSPPLDVSKDQFEDFSESNKEFSLTDDNSFSFDKIDYVEASPPDSELVSSEEDIYLIEKLLYDNSSSRPPKEFVSTNSDAKIKSFSPSPIFVKDSDSLMEEIDLFCTPNYPMPPGIVDEDYDSERDILIPKDLPSNNSLSFVKKESFHFDIPSFSRPPAKPPDGDTRILNIKMMGDISDQKAFMHKLMITLSPHQEKSPDLLSHWCGTVKKFNTHRSHLNECLMMIDGQNNPPSDVLLFHFYPP
nr:hypothetical protein [Tanacetum cinerariifolium]